MAHILVTGGAGFIGSHLVQALAAKGHSVRVLDDLSTGFRANLAGVAERIELIEASLLEPAALERAVRGVECVYHQAAMASVPRSVEDPWRTHQVNVEGTVRLLEACRRHAVRRVVFASSSSVYGESPTLPKHEKMCPDPLSPYALQKLSGEQYVLLYGRLYGLETIALRYFNVFGPRQNPESQYAAVIPIFITRLVRGEPPVVFGDGEQSRDFAFIDNVVQANLLCLEAGAGALGRAYNIACGDQTSLNDLLTLIGRSLGAQIPARYDPPRPGDVRHSLADIALARRHLGYAPSVSVAEGLERTIAYYRRLPAADARS